MCGVIVSSVRLDSYSVFWLTITVMAAGPSLMPGGTRDAYKHIEPIVKAVAAQVQPTLPASGMHAVSAEPQTFTAAMCTGPCIRLDHLWPVSAHVARCASAKACEAWLIKAAAE